MGKGTGTGTGTPGREAALPSAPQRKPRTARFEWVMPRRSPESGSACFLVRPGGRFLVPALRGGTGVARRGGQGRAQARPKGLSLTAPSTAPGLGAVGTREASSLRLVAGEPMRKTRTGSSSASPNRPSNTVIGAPSNSVSRLIGRLLQVCERWIYRSCLCFALDFEEQQRSGFRYHFSNEELAK